MRFGYAVYFTERDRNRVIRWDPDAGETDVVAGEPSDGDPTQLLDSPYGLVFDRSGALVIADKFNHRVCRLKGGKLAPLCLAHRGGAAGSRTDSPSTLSPLPLCPTGLFLEEEGSLLCTFSDDYTIYRIHENGDLEHLLGIPSSRKFSLSEPPERVRAEELERFTINGPTGIVKRRDGMAFFIERIPQLVRVYMPGRGVWSLFAHSARDQSGRKVPAPDQTTTRAYHPLFPASLALSPDGTQLYVSEAKQACVMRIDLRTARVVKVLQVRDPDPNDERGIAAVAFGPDGVAWVINKAAESIEPYLVPEVGPWIPLSPKLTHVRGFPLRLPVAGSGLALGN